MNATHLRIISCPREGGEMTGYNPDQQPKCRLTESAFRDDRLKPFFSTAELPLARGASHAMRRPRRRAPRRARAAAPEESARLRRIARNTIPARRGSPRP